MQIAVFGSDALWNELIQSNPSLMWIRVQTVNALFYEQAADAYFNLSDDYSVTNTSGKPYFIHAINKTLKELNADEKTIRINGWQTFLSNTTWEISGQVTEQVKNILTTLNKKIIAVQDVIGLISPRIIAMIINEAYFAEGEKVSAAKEIDTAMKLGTNYPYGPFEWAELIGLHNIYDLLLTLSANDKRYTIAPALAKKING